MKKLLSLASLFVASTVFSQQEPLFKLFDIQMYGGTYLTKQIELQPHDWNTLNPDGQATDNGKHALHNFRGVQGGNYRTLQAQFAIRKRNPMNKGLWLAGISVGTSSGEYASQYRESQSAAYVLDTVSYSSGAPSQLLVGDTISSARRALNVTNAHLGFSLGYSTNPSKMFSFKVRALLDISVSTESKASYENQVTVRQGIFSDTVDADGSLDNYGASTSSSQYEYTSYSTNSVFGVGLQVPVGISWQLSSFRPVLSRFSIGVEGAGGIRMIAIPKVGVYSVPTFSIGVNFAYRFNTWIPDTNNIRKIREKQRMEGTI